MEEHLGAPLRYDDNTPSHEKYRNRKNRTGQRERLPSHEDMLMRARERIIGAVHKKGNGFIYAAKAQDAVSVLKGWVRNDDGKLGKGQQVFSVLLEAFNQLCKAGVFTKKNTGYKLNPHDVRYA